MSFDISDTLAPNSDQLDAVDLLGGPRTFTIERVSKGSDDQPVNIHLTEFPRPWRPGKSMRRVLAAAWGTDASKYVGRRVTLYCDTNVMFGKDKVGGTRIKALSNITEPKRIPLLVSRGKSATYTVEPLTDPAPQPTTNTATPDQLKAIVTGLSDLGITDRANMLAYCTRAAGRALTSATDLTNTEAQTVLDHIETDLSGQAGDEPEADQ